MVANAIHGLGNRKDEPHDAVNCAALPANLISEQALRPRRCLHGAYAEQAGRFEVAKQGDDLSRRDRRAAAGTPIEAPAGCSRTASSRGEQRMKTVEVDARVIASIEPRPEGRGPCRRVREDLYRLNVFPVSDTAAQEADGRHPHPARFFTDKYSPQDRQADRTVPTGRPEDPGGVPWPGNVRELEHIIERAVIPPPVP